MKKKKDTKENPLATISYWAVNKDLARHLKSNDAVVFLAELMYKHDYWEEKGKLDKEDGFFVTGSDLERDTNINKRQRLKLTKILVGSGLIVVRRKGVTARNWYKIQFESIKAILKRLRNPPMTDPAHEFSGSENAPINNNISISKSINNITHSVLQKPKEEKAKKINKDENIRISPLAYDTFTNIEILDEVCQAYLPQHPEHSYLVNAMIFIIRNDKTIPLNPMWPTNVELCLEKLDVLIRGRGLSAKEVQNIYRIYEKNLEHQERLSTGYYAK